MVKSKRLKLLVTFKDFAEIISVGLLTRHVTMTTSALTNIERSRLIYFSEGLKIHGS